jgi:hypothetical protein
MDAIDDEVGVAVLALLRHGCVLLKVDRR